MNIYKHDVHFHLDLYKNLNEIINEIESNRIYTIAVTNLPPLYTKLKSQVQSKYIRVALGFHPELISDYEKYIPQMWKYIDDAKYIGEVGLDIKNKTIQDRNRQISFFKKLINLCNQSSEKVISIHSRNSEVEINDIIGCNFRGKVILHWYSGSINELKKFLRKGFFFSINHAMLTSQKGKAIINKIPNDRLLIESDGPFIKIKNRIVTPKDNDFIINKLAEIKNISKDDMTQILSGNFKVLIS